VEELPSKKQRETAADNISCGSVSPEPAHALRGNDDTRAGQSSGRQNQSDNLDFACREDHGHSDLRHFQHRWEFGVGGTNGELGAALAFLYCV